MKQMLKIFYQYLVRNRTSGVEWGGNFFKGFFKVQTIAYKLHEEYMTAKWHLL